MTSLSDSRCWMLSVEITSMPASSSCSTSCQRFSLREPGALVWAYSSTSTTSGRRARMASTSISCSTVSRYSTSRRGITSRSRDLLGGLDAAVGLDDPDHDVGAALGAADALAEHLVRLADAGRRTEVDAQRASGHLRSAYIRPVERIERQVERAARGPPARRGRRGRDRWCGRRSATAPRRARGRVRRRPAAPAGGRWRSRCAGSSPDADAVTASTGTSASAASPFSAR